MIYEDPIYENAWGPSTLREEDTLLHEALELSYERGECQPSPRMSHHPPQAIPPGRPVPFAPMPPAGSYWPVLTCHGKGRYVDYLAEGHSFKSYSEFKGRGFLRQRTSKGRRRWHVGVDIYAHTGNRVVACEAGKIVQYRRFYTRKNGEQTWKILIQHKGAAINYGEVTSDSLQRTGLGVGSTVQAGQHIGYVSGTAMVHFEMYTRNSVRSARWWKDQPTPPSNLLNPTKYLLWLARHGQSGARSSGGILPNIGKIADALRRGYWSVAVRLMIAGGERNENTLSNKIFWVRNNLPEGYTIKPNESAYKRDWLQIRDSIVRPALRGS